MNTQNQLAVSQSENIIAPLSEIERAADYIAKSNLFGVKTKEQAAALMLVAQSEGSHYARAALAYDIIQGRPALKSAEVLGRFQKSGGKIKYIQSSDYICEVELEHPQGGVITIKWDIDRAKKAGLAGKDNWIKYPAAMLRARAVAEGVRALFPACLGGFYAAEEVQDFEPLKPEASGLNLNKPEASGLNLNKPEPAIDTLIDETEAALEAPVSKAEKTADPRQFKVELDGKSNDPTSPAPAQQPKWVEPLCEWIKKLPNQEKAKEVIKHFCKPQNIGTLGPQQANSLINELATKFNAYKPIIDFSEKEEF